MGSVCLSYGKNTIFLYTLSISIIISGVIASYFLEILMIRYFYEPWPGLNKNGNEQEDIHLSEA